VSDRSRRYRPALGVVLDIAMDPIYRSGEKRAQDEREQHPILDDDIGGQREEVEADVLVVERVIRAVGHLIEEPQEDAPVVDLSPGDKHSEDASAAGDDKRPRQPMAQQLQHVGQGHNARGFPLEFGGMLRPLRACEARRKQSVQPQDGGGRQEDRKEHCRFGNDGRPEHFQIADCGKPQPIHQEVAHEAEQDQADRDENSRDDEPYHGASPRCPPPWSRDSDGHGSIRHPADDRGSV
jgi:hypothetical protein